MNIYIYIAAMALTTYLVRMLPLTVFRKPIRSRFFRSFLHYVPYACLAAMTFPAILQDTASVLSGAAALAVAIVLPECGDRAEHLCRYHPPVQSEPAGCH